MPVSYTHLTYENGEVFQHFGHTEQFKLYEVSGGKLLHTQVVENLSVFIGNCDLHRCV